MLNHVVIVVKP